MIEISTEKDGITVSELIEALRHAPGNAQVFGWNNEFQEFYPLGAVQTHVCKNDICGDGLGATVYAWAGDVILALGSEEADEEWSEK